MRQTRRLFVALAGLAFVVGACSSASEQVSKKIAENVKTQLSLTALPKTTCPKDAKAKKGSTFKCTTVVDGQDLIVDVVFTKDNFFNAKPEGDVEKSDEVESKLTAQGATDVDCGTKPLVVITDTNPLTCTYKQAGASHKIAFTFKDGQVSTKID